MEARLADVRSLICALRSLQLDKSTTENVQCEISENGLKFTSLNRSKDVHATCCIPSAAFREYKCYLPSGDVAVFDLMLSVLLNCLHVFGVNANLKLQYSLSEAVLLLILGESAAISECKIRIQEPEPLEFTSHLRSLFSESDDDDLDWLIMTPDVLIDAIMDMKDSDKNLQALIQLMPLNERQFAVTIGVEAQHTSVQWDMPCDPQVFHKYEVKMIHRHSYSLSSLVCCLRALVTCRTVKIRIESRGALCLTTLTRFSESSSKFCSEFILLPINEDYSLSKFRKGGPVSECIGTQISTTSGRDNENVIENDRNLNCENIVMSIPEDVEVFGDI